MNDEQVIQQDIEAILARLSALRQRIALLQQAQAPLKAEIETARREYQAVVGPLRLQQQRLEAEIAALREPVLAVRPSTPEPKPDETGGGEDSNGDRHVVLPHLPPEARNPEAAELDALLEFLVYVLDKDMVRADAELQADIEGLSRDPKFGLADALALLPDEGIFKLRSPKETLEAQRKRLATWEAALARQVAAAEQAKDALQRDRYYSLTLQRRRGPDAWSLFLANTAAQYRDSLAELQAERDRLNRE